MPAVHANGIDIYYEDTGGEGAPVVLIHGHSVDLRMWPAQVLALREAGYRVVRYDVRGHGRSSVPNEGYTWPVYAEDLRALLDTLDIGKAHLVGFSMGGGIALQFALDHPGRARSLVLVDAAVPGYAYSDEFASRVEALVEVVRREGWRSAAERLWLTHPMFAGLRRHPAAFEVVRDIVLRFPALDYLIDQPEPEGPEAIERLGELRPPVLVVVGAEDLEDFRLAAQLVAANAPRARLEIVEGAGHLVPLERPDALNRMLLDFLAGPEAAVAPALEVRPVGPEDLDAVLAIDGSFSTGRILRLERRGLAPELTFDFTVMARDGAEPRAIDGRGAYLRAGNDVLVATVDGLIVGAIALEADRAARSLQIHDLRVEPEVRGNGVGRALVDAAVRQAQGQGLGSVRVALPSDNLDAAAFFLRYSFRFSGFDDGLPAHPNAALDPDSPIALFFTYPVPPR